MTGMPAPSRALARATSASGPRAASRRRATAAASTARRSARGVADRRSASSSACAPQTSCSATVRSRSSRAATPRAAPAAPGPKRTPSAAAPAGMSTRTSRVAGPATTMSSPSIHTTSAQPSGSTRSTWPSGPATCDHTQHACEASGSGAGDSRYVALMATSWRSRGRGSGRGGHAALALGRPAPRLGRRGLDERLQKLAGVRAGRARDLLGRAAGDDLAAVLAALGTHVDDPVGRLDDVQVVLDDDDRVPLVDQAVQDVEQALDVREVQARGRLVEDVERAARGDLRELGRELHALRLATRQRRRRLAEPDVAEPDVAQRLQPPVDLRDVLEELDGLLDGHVEHVGDRLALEADLERLAVVALAVALLARDVDVGQEVHLDLDLAVAAADLAAPALDVEREAARLVAADPRLLRLGEQVADDVEEAGVRRRVGPRRAADRRLVDLDDLVDVVEARDAVVRAGPLARPVQAVGHRLEEDLVDERGLARARHARHGRHDAERHADVDGLEVVLARALDLQVPLRPAPPRGDLDLARAGEELAGQRRLDLHDLLGR